jgi:flagellar basal body-associated protein FliL
MKLSAHQQPKLSRADKEMPEGPSKLWLTIIAVLNVLMFAGLAYVTWGSET